MAVVTINAYKANTTDPVGSGAVNADFFISVKDSAGTEIGTVANNEINIADNVITINSSVFKSLLAEEDDDILLQYVNGTDVPFTIVNDVITVPDPVGGNGTANIDDSDGNQLYSLTVPAGGTVTQPISDSTAVVKRSDDSIIVSEPILAQASEDIPIADSPISFNSTLSTQVMAATSIDIPVVDENGDVLNTSWDIANDRLVVSMSAAFDPDAQLFFDEVGEMNDVYKNAYNDFVLGLKTDLVWSKGLYGFTVAPVFDYDKVLTNLFNPSDSPATLSGINSFVSASPGLNVNEIVMDRATYVTGSTFNEHILTGVNPSIAFSSNGYTIIEIISTGRTAQNVYEFGVFNSSNNSIGFNARNTGDLTKSWTAGATQLESSNSVVQFEIFALTDNGVDYRAEYKNGIVLDSENNSTGAFPNANITLNGMNRISPSDPSWFTHNKRTSSFLLFEALSDIELSIVTLRIKTLFDSMNRPLALSSTNYTKQIVYEGNSFGRYWAESVFKSVQLERPIDYERYINLAGSGETTTEIIGQSASSLAAYEPTYTQNTFILWEVTNDVFNNSLTEAAALANCETVINTVIGQGYDDALCGTMIAREHSGNAQGLSKTDWYLYIDGINTTMVANAGGVYGIVIDFTNTNLWLPRSSFASDAEFVTAIDAMLDNTTYYFDRVHLTAEGFKLAGEIIAQQLTNSGI